MSLENTMLAKRGSTMLQALKWIAGVVAIAVAGYTLSASSNTIPLVDLASEPLYMNGAKSKPTLTLDLSVEFPTVGATYRDSYDPAKEYIGYFDSAGCYNYEPGPEEFEWKAAAVSKGCGGSYFSGNFMNWATSSAIDILRYGLTGGDRVIDTIQKTVVQRAVLPKDYFGNASYFPAKNLPNAYVKDAVPSSMASNVNYRSAYGIWIHNCLNRLYMGSYNRTGSEGNSCDAPGSAGNLTQTSSPYYYVRNSVCDPSSNELRPDLCFTYPNGKSKPIGELQKNSDKLRVAVFGYLMDNNRTRYGGVLRAPMKYVGPKAFDSSYNELSGTNPVAEWDPDTGIFVLNPHNASENLSGAISYLNRFGRLNQGNTMPAPLEGANGIYKTLDPVTELYYESLRYLQGQQPTPDAVSNVTADMKDSFPYYSTWTDPYPDAADGDFSCQKNNILTIADVFTHSDRSVPGNNLTGNQDFVRAVNTGEPDARAWTRVVGGFESNNAVGYVDGEGTGRTTSNPNTPANAARWGMEGQNTGSNGGSYYMAGLAYWANTHDVRSDRKGMRVKTFTIDVNERNQSSDSAVDSSGRPLRWNYQLFLAAKYGGFDDRNKDGNPFAVDPVTGKPDNSKWATSGTSKEASTYYKVDNAKAFLASLREVFLRTLEETGSIAGGAVSTQRLTTSGGYVYQASFDPKFWTGKVLKYAITIDSSGNPVLATSPTWDAGVAITNQKPEDRNIWVGRTAMSSTDRAAKFEWANLEAAHQTALNISPDTGNKDSLGQDRVKFLRGDRSTEAPTGAFRQRLFARSSGVTANVLGDVVNSGLVYSGAPTQAINDKDYATFYETNKSRVPAVFFGANDGMLHAVNDNNGSEIFAYVPSFVVSKLGQLTSTKYKHQAFVDATPAVAEAKVGSAWRTVLVSGVGGGAQGIFALNVTNPNAFSAEEVMWEFTDKNDADLGNVIGQPQIVKMANGKWYAMVASGVNNYADDKSSGGQVSAEGNPAIFILSLDKPAGTAWSLNTNYFKIVLPSTLTTLAKGIATFETVRSFSGELQYVYAGDLHGNFWKLNFTDKTPTNWTAAGVSAFKSSGVATPFFVAKDGTLATSKVQPITMKPTVVFGPLGSYIVLFGTGKFLEPLDLSSPYQSQTFYALLDEHDKVALKGRQVLAKRTVDDDGTVSGDPFIWGAPADTSVTPPVMSGWYFDFFSSQSTGERAVTDATPVAGKLIFGSVIPATTGCGAGGGRIYSVGISGGKGTSVVSEVGILASPMVIESNKMTITASDSTGQRTKTIRSIVITQGSKGMQIQSPATESKQQVSRLSWRQINNFLERKNAK